MSLLQVRGVAKSFGSRLILDGLDLDVEPGARLGLIGPNGGGKSTLLRIVAGEETADRGELTLKVGGNTPITIKPKRVAFVIRIGNVCVLQLI